MPTKLPFSTSLYINVSYGFVYAVLYQILRITIDIFKIAKQLLSWKVGHFNMCRIWSMIRAINNFKSKQKDV